MVGGRLLVLHRACLSALLNKSIARFGNANVQACIRYSKYVNKIILFSPDQMYQEMAFFMVSPMSAGEYAT